MAHLERFADDIEIGFDKAQAADLRAQIRKLNVQREAEAQQIIRALELAGEQMAVLKAELAEVRKAQIRTKAAAAPNPLENEPGWRAAAAQMRVNQARTRR